MRATGYTFNHRCTKTPGVRAAGEGPLSSFGVCYTHYTHGGISMKRTITLLTLMSLLLIPAASFADHSRVDLVPVARSGVNGFVQATQMPSGVNILVQARGLTAGTVYA